LDEPQKAFRGCQREIRRYVRIKAPWSGGLPCPSSGEVTVQYIAFPASHVPLTVFVANGVGCNIQLMLNQPQSRFRGIYPFIRPSSTLILVEILTKTPPHPNQAGLQPRPGLPTLRLLMRTLRISLDLSSRSRGPLATPTSELSAATSWRNVCISFPKQQFQSSFRAILPNPTA
jgi:hypothetical protein